MAEEERPTKLRKLSHDSPAAAPDTAPTPSDGFHTPDTADEPLSKRAQKRLAKAAAWEASRGERAELRKEKTAARKQRQRSARDAMLAASGQTIADYARARAAAKPHPVQLPMTFLIDCGYDGLMRDNERVSLASQITRCYGENKRALYRGHVVLSSFGGKLQERYEGVLRGGYRSWKGFRYEEEGFKSVSDKAAGWMREAGGGEMKGPFEGLEKGEGEVVYLSSEAEETLTELKPFGTYIIGGLVDKNREKGICYKAACDAGIRTARLPIGEYLEMQSRKVLATNHVVEIMLKWLEYRDWGKAFLDVIPKRKGGALKGEGGKGADEEEDGDEVEEDNAAEDVEDAPEAGPASIDGQAAVDNESDAVEAETKINESAES